MANRDNDENIAATAEVDEGGTATLYWSGEILLRDKDGNKLYEGPTDLMEAAGVDFYYIFGHVFKEIKDRIENERKEARRKKIKEQVTAHITKIGETTVIGIAPGSSATMTLGSDGSTHWSFEAADDTCEDGEDSTDAEGPSAEQEEFVEVFDGESKFWRYMQMNNGKEPEFNCNFGDVVYVEAETAEKANDVAYRNNVLVVDVDGCETYRVRPDVLTRLLGGEEEVREIEATNRAYSLDSEVHLGDEGDITPMFAPAISGNLGEKLHSLESVKKDMTRLAIRMFASSSAPEDVFYAVVYMADGTRKNIYTKGNNFDTFEEIQDATEDSVDDIVGCSMRDHRYDDAHIDDLPADILAGGGEYEGEDEEDE